METIVILNKVDQAIRNFLENEIDLLRRRLNELSFSFSLARELTPLFEDYNVDAEYSGDVEKPNDRKELEISNFERESVGKKSNHIGIYKFTPDVIIHKRGTNTQNLVVIEVKKDNSPISEKKNDIIRLKKLTKKTSVNHYNYKLGIALELGTKENAGNYEIKFFQNGIEVLKQDLT